MYKVVLSGIYYPMAILRFFEKAFQRRDDVELYTVGPYTENWIPWKGGMYLPDKYSISPDMPLDKSLINSSGSYLPVVPFEPDLWVQVDAGFYFVPKGNETFPVVHVATDPHVLNYGRQRMFADYFFNMQQYYSDAKDLYLPYAADPLVHRHLRAEEFEFDVAMVGLQYPDRLHIASFLRRMGYSVYCDTGPVFDEYAAIHARSRLAISISSKQDLIARVFECTAMGIPLITNYVPDLSKFFQHGEHLTVADSVEDAVEKAINMLDGNYSNFQLRADSTSLMVHEHHTWDHRVAQIMSVLS